MASAGFTVTAPADNAHRLNAVDAIATFTVCMTYSKTWGVTHLSRQWLTIGLRPPCLLLTDNCKAELRRPGSAKRQHGEGAKSSTSFGGGEARHDLGALVRALHRRALRRRELTLRGEHHAFS